MTPQPTPVLHTSEVLILTESEIVAVCTEVNVSRGTLALFLPELFKVRPAALTILADSPTLRRKVAGSRTTPHEFATTAPCTFCLQPSCDGQHFGPPTTPENGV